MIEDQKDDVDGLGGHVPGVLLGQGLYGRRLHRGFGYFILAFFVLIIVLDDLDLTVRRSVFFVLVSLFNGWAVYCLAGPLVGCEKALGRILSALLWMMFLLCGFFLL